MRALLANLRDLCLFRRGPEEMPYSPPLLAVLLAACGVLMAWFSVHNGASVKLAAASVAGGFGFAGALFMILRLRGKPERFVQTLTALAAVYLLFGLAADLLVANLDLQVLVKQAFEHPRNPPALGQVESLQLLGFSTLGFWQLFTSIGIVRRAGELPLPGALLAMIVLVIANWFAAGLAAGLLGA